MSARSGYRIEFARQPIRFLHKAPKSLRQRLASVIDTLQTDSRPPGSKQLVQSGDVLYRLRVGDYRIIYSIESHRVLILILRIGHRRDVYRSL